MQRYRPHLIATLSIGLPLIGSHIARMLIGVADTIMIGWYGVDELAALVLANSVYFIFFLLGAGYGFSVMGVIAAAIARDDEVEVRRATRMALWLSIIHSTLCLPFMWWSGPILVAFGQNPELAALAQDYNRIIAIALFAALGGATLTSYLAALGRTQFVLWLTVAGLPVNVFLNWVLIFGNLGAPEMGVQGAAIASLITQWAQLAIMVGYAVWLPAARKYALLVRFWKPDWLAMRQVFMLGLPVGLAMLAEAGMFTGTNIMMGWIGKIELAAHGIALQVASLTFMVPLGLGNAATIRIGQMQGLGDKQGMAEAARTVIWLAVAFSALTAAVFILTPGPIIALYLDSTNPQTPVIISTAVILMFWAGLFQLADGTQVAAMGLLRGVQDTAVPMMIASIAYWIIGLPAGYLFAFTFGFGPQGLWMGLLVGLIIAAVLLLRRFWRGWARGDWTPPRQAG